MGKTPVLNWVGMFYFGLALAGGGCESCSNTAKRTPYNPTPTIVKNTGTPATTSTAAANGTQPGTGMTAAATVNPPVASTSPVAPATPVIQTVGATSDPSRHGMDSPMNPYLQQAPAQGTSNLGPQDTTRSTDAGKPPSVDGFATPPVSSAARDDGLGRSPTTGVDSISGTPNASGPVLPLPPSSTGDTGHISIAPPAPPAPPASTAPESMPLPPLSQSGPAVAPPSKLSGY